MLSVELPVEWQAEQWVTQATVTNWRLHTNQPPRLQQLGCEVFQLTENLKWCEHDRFIWLLQKQEGVYWLSQYRRDDPAAMGSSRNWRGSLMQRFRADGQVIMIYQSEHHPRQLETFVNLRYQAREPQFMELSHGRFYLSLQNPTEDIFIYARVEGTLVVSAAAL